WITAPTRVLTGGPNPDQMFLECQRVPPISTFNFFDAGRLRPNNDFSDGWPFAWHIATLYNHFAPPNWKGTNCGSIAAIAEPPHEHAISPPRSSHPGGVNLLLGDGSVKFVKDTVNLQTWRALGSRNGGEAISSDAY